MTDLVPSSLPRPYLVPTNPHPYLVPRPPSSIGTRGRNEEGGVAEDSSEHRPRPTASDVCCGRGWAWAKVQSADVPCWVMRGCLGYWLGLISIGVMMLSAAICLGLLISGDIAGTAVAGLVTWGAWRVFQRQVEADDAAKVVE
jgi:hypothetical protein